MFSHLNWIGSFSDNKANVRSSIFAVAIHFSNKARTVIKKLLFLFLLIFSTVSQAQFGSLSPAAEISIITVGPGSQLYDKFGHSAFRIKDSLSGVDVAFNYGVYDFETPNFYTKFAQGKLLYELRVSDYRYFYQTYVQENRWIQEQVLNLTKAEKQDISDFLWDNALPENRKYKYDFFYDNCATKIMDVVEIALGAKLEYQDDYFNEKHTFRDLIQQNLKANTWGSLGIDVALGAVIDRPAKPIEYQFLPHYVFESAAHGLIHREGETVPLVKSTKTVFTNSPEAEKTNFFLSPFFVLGVLGLLIIIVTLLDFLNNKRSRFLDAVIFGFTGVIGIFLLFLWLGTDHTATANNYNLLWAFPLSLFLVYAVSKKNPSPQLKRYIMLLILLLALLTIHWITGVQVFAITLVPLFVALAVRYLFLYNYLQKLNPDGNKKS